MKWVVLLLLSISSLAQAFEGGDFLLRFGPTIVDPHNVDSDTVTVNDMPLPGGSNVGSIDSDLKPGVMFTYLFTPYFGLELLAAIPFEHTVKLEDKDNLGIRRLGTTKQLPPTLSALLYPVGFFAPSSRWQPFIGLGINHINFFDEDASGEIEDFLGEKVRFDLHNSWGLAARAGIDIPVYKRLMFQAGVWMIRLDTEAILKGETSGTRIKAKDVESDIWVYTLGVGFQF